MADDIRIVLRSALFRDNERLQRAASDHRHHVMLRDEGEHVRRIQMFLLWYGNVPDMVNVLMQRREIGPLTSQEIGALAFYEMFQTETMGALYGPRTEDLVRSYKDMHGIVDRTRQSRADGIVGIRTIREMDRLALTAPNGGGRAANDRQQAASKVAHALKPAVMAGPVVGTRMLRA